MQCKSGLAGLAVCLLLAAGSAARAAAEDPIQEAIDRGVAYLKQMQRDDGTWPYPQVGATALAGLTLVECGVPAKDEAVQKAADVLRRASIDLTHTYSLSLAIMFLDRLGDPADDALIESMVIRLMAGQDATGGWDYECPPIGENEVRRLRTQLQQRSELVAKADLPKALPGQPRDSKDLPKEIQDQLKLINQQMRITRRTDNSNTQFATLALWVGRRHGMPVDRALALVDRRFRTSQNADGGWGYSATFGRGAGRMHSTAPMTCAGLLGLAVGHGVANAPQKDGKEERQKPGPDAARDPAVRAGLLALGTAIGQPAGKNVRRLPIPVIDRNFYYFLWSLERVAVAYSLKTIGKKDWYAWGSEVLLSNQQQDGSWSGAYGEVDTCFALLFLRRANLAQDLSATLKGKVDDPGEVTLKSGGVGGASLQEQVARLPIHRADDKGPQSKEEKPPVKHQAAPPAQDDQRHDKPSRSEAREGVDVDAQSARLSGELVKASGPRRQELIDKYRDSKGVAYTQALAQAIYRLEEPARGRARDALAERLMRMTAATLQARLRDQDAEMRSAAALACAMKEERGHIPDLIQLLEDPEARVAKAAHLALKTLSQQDFGPPPRATPQERSAAAAKWKAWWSKQNRK